VKIVSKTKLDAPDEKKRMGRTLRVKEPVGSGLEVFKFTWKGSATPPLKYRFLGATRAQAACDL
jgi:hypothetical protein